MNRSRHPARSAVAARPAPTPLVPIAAASALLLLGALALGGTARAQDAMTVELKDPDGAIVGEAVLTALPNGGVHLHATLEGLAPGTHGFHLHETGSCDPADGFKSAGGHLAGTREHGLLVEGGPHPGDMPNLHVPASGSLEIEVVNTLVSLDGDGTDGMAALLDADGSALLIHSGADDYTSQPSGDAGERVACAEITAGG